MRRSAERERRRKIRRGQAYIIAIAATATTIFFIDVVRREFLEGPTLIVTAERAAGLEPGADVWVAGKRAGRVTRIRFGDPAGPTRARVIIRAVLFRATAPYVRSDANVRISPSALLAPAILEVNPGSPEALPYDYADTMRVETGVRPEAVLARSKELRPRLDTLAELSRRLQRRIDRGEGTLGKLKNNPGLVRRLRDDLSGVADLAERLRTSGSLARLRDDDSLRVVARRALARGRAIMLAHDSMPGRVRALEDLPQTLVRMSARLDTLRLRLDAGRGTAGRVLADGELRRQMDRLSVALAEMRSELMRDPLRWLRVRPF